MTDDNKAAEGVKPIIATAAIALEDAGINPAAPPHTYFGVAEKLMPGIRILASSSKASLALPFLAAHTLECLLKAFICRDGSEASIKAVHKNRDTRHNLNWLWTEAAGQGLGISQTPPCWVDKLSQLHNRPYYLRYSEGVNGFQYPAAEPMVTDLETLGSLVCKHL